jgi:hypothetical protein
MGHNELFPPTARATGAFDDVEEQVPRLKVRGRLTPISLWAFLEVRHSGDRVCNKSTVSGVSFTADTQDQAPKA